MTKVKICGLSRADDIRFANELMPDYIGFVFAKASRRYVAPQYAGLLKTKLNPKIKAVGVFVNEPLDKIQLLLENGVIDAVQLHGNESETYISTLKSISDRPIIKAFRISSVKDIDTAVTSTADYILLDNGSGGTGKTFDWSLLSDVNRPFFLAGGLDAANVTEALRTYKPYAVDTSSGVEIDGCKDYNKMKEFITKVRCPPPL